MLVVDTLLDRLCLFEAIADVVEEGCVVLHLLGNSSNARLAGLIRADGRRVAAIDHAERCLPERRLEGGVVGVLGPQEPTEPLPRTVAGEAAEVHDDHPVGGLRLAIHLRVKSRRHEELGAGEAHELGPERGREHRVAVRDNGLRNTMKADDVAKSLGDGLGGVGVRQRDEVAVLAEAVDDGEDDRLALHSG